MIVCFDTFFLITFIIKKNAKLRVSPVTVNIEEPLLFVLASSVWEFNVLLINVSYFDPGKLKKQLRWWKAQVQLLSVINCGYLCWYKWFVLLSEQKGGFLPSLHTPADPTRKGTASGNRKSQISPLSTFQFSHREDFNSSVFPVTRGVTEQHSLLPPLPFPCSSPFLFPFSFIYTKSSCAYF